MEYNSKKTSSLQSKVSQAHQMFLSAPTIDSLELTLLFLQLRKNGTLYNLGNEQTQDFFSDLEAEITTSQLDNADLVLAIFNVFKHDIAILDGQQLKTIISLYNSITDEELETSYKVVFENTLYSMTKKKGLSYLFMPPFEITKLVGDLADLNPGDRVFDPYAGLASFAVNLGDEVNYYGQENHPNSWALGQLRLLANEKERNATLANEEPLSHWDPSLQKYDCIINNAPMGIKTPDYVKEWAPGIDRIEHFLIHQGLKSLNPDGKIIHMGSPAILYMSGQLEDLRKQLVDNDLLDTIISLPAGLLNGTSIPMIIFIINKNKKGKGHVRFINADSYFRKSSSRQRILNYDKLCEEIIKDAASGIVKYVPLSQIQENEYMLNVPRYFLTELKVDLPSKLVNLSELVSLVPKSRGIHNGIGKLVTIRSLKNDRLDYTLDSSIVEEIELSANATMLAGDAVLIATLGKEIKPTFFKYNGEPLYINPGVIALKVDETKVDISYLIAELQSDYVLKQLEAFRYGPAMPAIRKEDLLKIKIELIELNEQKAKVKGMLEAMAEEKKREFLLFNKIHGLESAIVEQNAYLRHSLAGASSNLKGSVEALRNIISNQVVPLFPTVLQLKVGETHTLDLGKYLEIIERDISKIVQTTSRVTNSMDPTAGKELYPVEIYNFVSNYVREKQEIKKLSYKLDFTWDEKAFTDENGNIVKLCISANEELLSILLDNLIHNAEQHAFPGYTNNRIEIYLMIHAENNINTEISLLVSNTGKPFPDDFNINDYRRKGNTAGNFGGDGYGGWLVSTIVNYFGGSVDIIDEQGAEGLPGTDLASSFEINIPAAEVLFL